MSDLKECKIIDTIDNIKNPQGIIQTPCGKFLIGVEKQSIFTYNLKTKQKFRIAGSVDQPGYQDGTRDESRFFLPEDLTLSKDLKTLFVADTWNQVIRAICVGTGITKTFAGQFDVQNCVDGPKEKACFVRPKTLKLSPDGNTLFVADECKLRTICIATGQVNTINTFVNGIYDFTFSPDGKHILILHQTRLLKYNLETRKSEIIFKIDGVFNKFELSKNGQFLFVSKSWEECIRVVNLDTKQVIDTINTFFEPYEITNSINGKQLYINDYDNDKIQVLDISNYCTNFKTFIQLQLSKYSFLPRQVVKSISI